MILSLFILFIKVDTLSYGTTEAFPSFSKNLAKVELVVITFLSLSDLTS